MSRKNARTTAFPQAVTSFRVSDGAGFVADIRGKDFPDQGVFRVYRVEGDVTKPEALETAIHNLLTDHGVEKRRVEITL